jgi:hypothetical protein
MNQQLAYALLWAIFVLNALLFGYGESLSTVIKRR